MTAAARQRPSLEDLPANAWVSLGRIAAHYGVSYKVVWRDLKAGGLPFSRIGGKRVIRVRVSDALKWGDPS